MTISRSGNWFVAVTGAQGVGKSTFCRTMRERLESSRRMPAVTLLDGLGDRMKASGIPLGSASTSETIAAVFAAHLEREASAPSGTVVILDRCVVDALAYARALGVTSDVELHLYEQITVLAAKRLSLVVHLQLSSFFDDIGASHETPMLRRQVATNISEILDAFNLSRIDLNAAADDSIDQAVSFVWEKIF